MKPADLIQSIREENAGDDAVLAALAELEKKAALGARVLELMREPATRYARVSDDHALRFVDAAFAAADALELRTWAPMPARAEGVARG